MPSRRVLNSVAHDVLEALISRNDDVGGYWALGLLVTHALATSTNAFTIDLVCGSSTPSLAGSSIATLPAVWHEQFWRNIEHQRLERGLIAVAVAAVQVDFDHRRESTRGGSEEYYVPCRLDIQDDRGKSYSRTANVWCSVHDPSRELRSARGA